MSSRSAWATSKTLSQEEKGLLRWPSRGERRHHTDSLYLALGTPYRRRRRLQITI